MKVSPSEYRSQACPEFDRRAWAGSEAKIHKASFFERRLFYLIGELCYKRMRCD